MSPGSPPPAPHPADPAPEPSLCRLSAAAAAVPRDSPDDPQRPLKALWHPPLGCSEGERAASESRPGPLVGRSLVRRSDPRAGQEEADLTSEGPDEASEVAEGEEPKSGLE